MPKKFQGEQNNNESILYKKTRRKRNYIIYPILSILILFLTIHELLLQSYGEWLTPVSEELTSDIAVVLYANGEEPLNLAADLLKRGKVKLIYADAIPQKRMNEFISRHNLLPDQVIWGGCVIPTTFDHAKNFKNKLEESKFSYSSILIIFKHYQLRRTEWIFRHILGPSTTIKTAATKSEIERHKKYSWWNHPESRFFVSSETQKMMFYYIYYGLLHHQVSKDIEFQDALDIEGTKYTAEQYWKIFCN